MIKHLLHQLVEKVLLFWVGAFGYDLLEVVERDLQRRLRPCSLWDGLWRQLKRLPIGDPALDVLEAAFAARLVERPHILK